MKVKSWGWLCFLCWSTGVTLAQEKVELSDVITKALEKNYDVRLARNTSESAQTDDNYAWAAYAPQVNGTGSMVWNNNQQKLEFQDANRNSEGKATSNATAASVQLYWLLFDGTRMFTLRNRIASIAEQSEIQVKDQMNNTIAAIIGNYYNIVRQKQQLNATKELMAVSEERVKLAERKLQVGTGGKPELLQAKVDYNAQRTQVIQQETIIVQLKEQLNAHVGQTLPALYEVSDTILIDLNLRIEDIVQNLENNNLSLVIARKNLEIAGLSLRERRAEYSPLLSFNAAYNFNTTDNTRLINPFGSVYNQTKGYNYGLLLTVPIFNGLNTRRLVQQAEINVDRQQVFYEQQKTNVDMSLKNAFVNYDNAKRVLLIEEENILLARENVFIALEGFKRGITTFIELRTTQQSLADAYNRLINSRYLAKIAETELLRLKGALVQPE
jgi:outer membrane protein TolC